MTQMKLSNLHLIVFPFALAGLVGCANLQRSTESGYQYRDSEVGLSRDSGSGPNLGRDRTKTARDSAASELGLAPKQVDLSGRDQDALDLRISLNQAEKALEGRREKEQYFKNKPYMASDRDRLMFLQLESFESRQKWLSAKGIQGPATPNTPYVQSLVDVNDIALGMTKQAVRDSWGEPDLVEVAGNPIYGNERWHYSEQTSSTEGFQSQKRILYFESARVVGWESR